MTNEQLHNFRKQIDECIQVAEAFRGQEPNPEAMRANALVRTKLQEAKMWVGKCLEAIGSELPAEYQDKFVHAPEPEPEEDED